MEIPGNNYCPAKLESSEDRTIKSEYKTRLIELEAKFIELSRLNVNFDDLLNRAIQSLSKTDEHYEKSDNEIKRQIMVSILV